MIILIMGTTGSGKTTIGTLLAQRTGWEFADADEFHPRANVEKMSRGLPLDDADRAPWLVILHDKIAAWLASHKNAILACSALKRSYREQLLVTPEVKLVYLKGTYELFAERIHARVGHFAKEGILVGQFRDLEEPENALTLGTQLAPEQLVAQICAQLALPCS
ncbi:MAG TPA: gluconokinase [Candidatus Bathyarchaeia archaeon]|nr:gluconokinase [Candidatus Bathyarchaeia archaeon]